MARALHIQNESTDPAGLFVDALERHGFTVDTLHPYAGDELPASLHGIDALVAGGGLVDTHQAGEHPWLAQEIELVREALERRTPYMGLCLGAQVLTEAAGGTVYRLRAARDRLARGGADAGRRRRRPVRRPAAAVPGDAVALLRLPSQQRRRRADDQPGLAAGAAGR